MGGNHLRHNLLAESEITFAFVSIFSSYLSFSWPFRRILFGCAYRNWSVPMSHSVDGRTDGRGLTYLHKQRHQLFGLCVGHRRHTPETVLPEHPPAGRLLVMDCLAGLLPPKGWLRKGGKRTLCDS